MDLYCRWRPPLFKASPTFTLAQACYFWTLADRGTVFPRGNVWSLDWSWAVDLHTEIKVVGTSSNTFCCCRESNNSPSSYSHWWSSVTPFFSFTHTQPASLHWPTFSSRPTLFLGRHIFTSAAASNTDHLWAGAEGTYKSTRCLSLLQI
jgi:hypothetical protein